MTQKYTTDQLKELAAAAAVRRGLDPQTFVAQIEQESSWNPKAKSSAGARGLAQFMPNTLTDYPHDPFDPVASLDAGARYMAQLTKQFGSEELARQAYNGGQGTLRKHLQDPEKHPLRKETREYNSKIYARMPGGAPAPAAAPTPGAPLPAPDASGRIELPDDITPSAAGAGRGFVNPAPDGALGAGIGGLPDGGAFAIAATELGQGLPPGALTPAPAAPNWQDQLQALSGDAPAAVLGQTADLGVLDSLASGDDLTQRARDAQNATLGRMFADMGAAENPDAPSLPAGVNRYLDKILG